MSTFPRDDVPNDYEITDRQGCYLIALCRLSIYTNLVYINLQDLYDLAYGGIASVELTGILLTTVHANINRIAQINGVCNI